MKIIFTLFCLALISYSSVSAQSGVFTPLNFLKAVENNTRTLSGRPNENYWQNSSDYFIKVRIHPIEQLLEGSGKIIYYNNSPDTLETIYMRLYQNIQKQTAPRDAEFSKEWFTDGVIVNSLKIGNVEFNVDDRKQVSISATNMRVKLIEPLMPTSEIEIEINWSVEIPKFTWRLGYYDSTSAFIAYWYPQVSVYDDIDGWDILVYKGYAEMYNDFNNYNVEITVPENFCVWATGMLQNPAELLTDEYLNRYQLALQSDEVINIITKEDLKNGNIFLDKSELTYKFMAEKVPDFAFGFSDHYLWDAANLKLSNGNDVYVAAAYKSESDDFHEVTQIAKECLVYFSEELPGVPYPFPSAVVFNGSGGMEFPMIVNNGSTSSKVTTVGLTAHELVHQYMPFYLGTNERKYAWMDEGWAVMLPFDYQEQYGNQRRLAAVKAYESIAGTEDDIPPMVLSHHLTLSPYRNAAYNRPGIAYMFLRDFLGDELFKSALHEFIHRWNGKHPHPMDFFNTFNHVAGEDLSWFWNPWFYDFGFPDLSIKNVNKQGEKLFITVEKNGNVPVPISLRFIYEADWEKVIYYSADIWKDNKSEFVIEFEPDGLVVGIELGNDTIPDSDRQNNFVRLSDMTFNN